MKIGNLTFSSPFILAPLAGYSDAAFRHICAECGAAAAVTEMVSAEGLAREGVKTEDLLKRFEGEENLIIQLFAPDADPISRALDRALSHKPAMIDINCGCPVPKVVKTGAGSALMHNPEKIYEIVRTITSRTDIPVSVKFRLGWDHDSINYLEFAREAARGGASAFTLHARTRSQGYSGNADWSHIRRLKQEYRNSGITVFGSGDVFSAEDAVRMIEETDCDGVMCARGAIGNPFIFREARALLEAGSYTRPALEERKAVIIRHLDYMIQEEGEAKAVREMRKHVCAYVKGIEGSNKVKVKAVEAKSREDYIEALSLLK